MDDGRTFIQQGVPIMPTTSLAWHLQDAVYSVLSADSELMGQVKKIYHDVPENVAYPYIHMRVEGMEEWSTVSNTGVRVLFSVEIEGKERSPETVMTIAARVKALLHNTHPPIPR
jgi:hypothetical protein